MLTEKDAKRVILNEWSKWNAKTGANQADMRAFYEWLKSERPTLLNFRATGDRWERVKIWLIRGR